MAGMESSQGCLLHITGPRGVGSPVLASLTMIAGVQEAEQRPSSCGSNARFAHDNLACWDENTSTHPEFSGVEQAGTKDRVLTATHQAQQTIHVRELCRGHGRPHSSSPQHHPSQTLSQAHEKPVIPHHVPQAVCFSQHSRVLWCHGSKCPTHALTSVSHESLVIATHCQIVQIVVGL